jgi:hypothetical protein
MNRRKIKDIERNERRERNKKKRHNKDLIFDLWRYL